MNEDLQINAFCERCHKHVSANVSVEKIAIFVRGVGFKCLEGTATCSHCGKEVYAREINDMNCVLREHAFRKAKEEQHAEK